MNNNTQIWFTSDTHFGHENVIKYSNRPYNDKHHMDEGLIANWNARVSPTDTVYHLGDVFFCQEVRALEILKRLNGEKHLILGNHDKQLKRVNKLRDQFVRIADYLEVTVGAQKIILCHYPMITWNGIGRGTWMLHGHCHGNLKYPVENKIHDAGVDPNGYFPISFDQVKRIMDKKNINALDHHGAKNDED